jgi:hypothetical protein
LFGSHLGLHYGPNHPQCFDGARNVTVTSLKDGCGAMGGSLYVEPVTSHGCCSSPHVFYFAPSCHSNGCVYVNGCDCSRRICTLQTEQQRSLQNATVNLTMWLEAVMKFGHEPDRRRRHCMLGLVLCTVGLSIVAIMAWNSASSILQLRAAGHWNKGLADGTWR